MGLFDGILNTRTAAELVAEAKAQLTAWGSKLRVDPAWGTAYDAVKVQAYLVRRWIMDPLVNLLLPNVFLTTSSGAWTDEHARSYGRTRTAARKARLYLTFTRSDSDEAASVDVDWCQTEADSAGKRYRFKRFETAEAAIGETSVDCQFEAEFAGADYNVGEETVIEMVGGSSAFDSVTNADRAGDEFEFLARAGWDEQTDESLIAECVGQWSTQQRLANALTYQTLVREVVPDALVDVVWNDEERGLTKLYVTGETGPAAASTLLEIDSHIRPLLPGSEELVVTTYQNVDVEIEATITVDPSTSDEVLAALGPELETYLARLFDIRDTGVRRFKVGEDCRLDRLRLAAGAYVDQVYPETYLGMDFTSPADDVSVDEGRKAQLLSISISVERAEAL